MKSSLTLSILLMLFATNAWADYQRVGQQMRGLFDRAEVKISMHGLRHTCITNWLAEDVPLKMVSTLAGHSSIAITLDRYGHVLESDSVKFMDKLYSRMLG